ncbi:hypothetical protein LOTGIDRAFT_165177 [Lottia gigantea]|uniref:BZIP domain-containing protein n=1 Tax=Lottia gigantea TaxID=225164 RepID=V4BJ08_LOTGI|nr:hypothetical protein LOTGIDRAFT_165177 [Lottia gigantea]ESO88764.1 hypothetical protein LOTGIDRAFT_165177 [Lottia gigantea]
MQEMSTSGNKRKSPNTVYDEDGFNDRLKRAARKSESEGSLTPMVKEELRCFIAAKRHSEGKQEMKVEFKQPEKHPLTAEEMMKKERRREQNRKAATKCRRKKKNAKIEKESEMKTLKNENEKLSEMVRELQGQVKQYAAILRHHEQSGQCALQPKEPVSLIHNIPSHLFEDDGSPEIDSPQSPRSFFSSSAEIRLNSGEASCPGYVSTHYANQEMTRVIGECFGFGNIQLNSMRDFTPPVSPHLTEFSENSLGDPQLSDLLRDLGSSDM